MRGWESRTLPNHVLQKIDKGQRDAVLGKAGRTAAEATAANTRAREKELQQQLLALLTEHRGIVVIYSRMDRKPTTPVGTPDFLFAVNGIPYAWEIKVPGPGERRTPEQIEMARRMQANGWRYSVVESVAQAMQLLLPEQEHKTVVTLGEKTLTEGLHYNVINGRIRLTRGMLREW